jgi:organic radical activating enzyme
MPKRVFPIKSSTSCRLKWSWSTLFLNQGTTASCHRSSFSDIPKDFENFHNTDTKIHDRNVMLNGQWPANGCEYCRDIEQSSGVSDRLFQNRIPNVYPAELDQTQSLTRVSPVILEVFFSNVCNLACVYCNATYSSTIQAENSKFGGAIMPVLDFTYKDSQYKELVPKFWDWFENNSTSLQRFQILGGEPFLQKEILQLIDYFESTPHPNLELNLITNLMVPDVKFDQILKSLSLLKLQNKLKRIDIQVSVDCWGENQEYIRHGFKLDTFERNLLKLIDAGNFRIGLLSTVTSLSISTMPALATKYNEWCKKQKIFWYMHLVLPNNESIFDPTMFDYSLFDQYLADVRTQLPTKTWDDTNLLDTFDGIVSKLSKLCLTDIDRQSALLQYLRSNDQRRSINWENNFPWLEQHFRKNHVV